MSHCQDNNTEDLLRLLLRSDGCKFEEDIIKNWYRARKFVLGTLVANDVFDNIIRQQQKNTCCFRRNFRSNAVCCQTDSVCCTLSDIQ